MLLLFNYTQIISGSVAIVRVSGALISYSIETPQSIATKLTCLKMPTRRTPNPHC